MNQRLAIIIFAFAFVVAVVAGFYSPKDDGPSPSDFRAKVRENLPNLKIPLIEKGKVAAPAKREPSSVKETVAPVPSTKPVTVNENGLNPETFSKKYGDALTYSTYEGRVTRIDGTRTNASLLEGDARVPSFHTQSESDLLGRSSEVLSDAGSMLGVDRNTAFLAPQAEGGDYTGRVTYQQAIDGVPIYPNGVVTVVMGGSGELRSLDSSIYPSTRILNQVTQPQPPNTRLILLVTESAPVALLRYAYDAREKGIQTVTDAQTGTVLLRRDRRIR